MISLLPTKDQLSEVMSAMTYLHDLGIVHGDLKGVRLIFSRRPPSLTMNQANILVGNTGAALVADFGLMSMVDLSTLLSETVGSPGGTYRWMSPELLDPKSFGSNGCMTRESDCYALGMIIYEVTLPHSSRRSLAYTFQVLTGLKPFYNMPGLTCVPAVLRGEHPLKPSHAESLGFSDNLWGLTQSCWSETASTRPTAWQLLDCLSLASPAWVPPAVYPVIVVDPSTTADSESPDSEDIPYEPDIRGIGTDGSASVSVIPILVLFLFLSIAFASLLPIRRSN